MNYFELIPYELISIIISYLDTNLDELQNLRKIKPINTVISRKSFWFNQLSFRELDEFIPAYKLMIDHDIDYFKSYYYILMIQEYLDDFKSVSSYLDLPIDSEELDMTKFTDPNDLSYFQNHVTIDLIKMEHEDDVNPFEHTLLIENSNESNDFMYIYTPKIPGEFEFISMNQSQFIIIVTKCIMFDIDIREPPVSDLNELLEDECDDYRYIDDEFDDYYGYNY